MREVQDCMGGTDHEIVILMKSPQVGGSEGARNAIGRWIDTDPGPCLIVFPSGQSATEMIDERLIPMILSSPRLRQHMTGVARHLKLTQVRLRPMTIYSGTAGSPQALASRPIRYVICDEVDKYPLFSGREADPVGLAEVRTRTYRHRRKLILVSTPTTTDGVIARWFNGTEDRRYYYVPCRECGHEQKLTFKNMRWRDQQGRIGVIIPKDPESRQKLAATLTVEDVFIACEQCGHLHHETDKYPMLKAGHWESLCPNAADKRVAFHLPVFISPWVPWFKVAVEFLISRETLEDQLRFTNQWLGEPFEERVKDVTLGAAMDRVLPLMPRGRVPPWSLALVSTADTQKGAWWWATRAHGVVDGTPVSHLVDYGMARTLGELCQKTLENRRSMVLGIDIGGGVKTEDGGDMAAEIYAMSLRDPRIWPLKGRSVRYGSTDHKPMQVARITFTPPGMQVPTEVLLRTLDTQYYKDVLASRIAQGDPVVWTLPADVCDEYRRQLVSEHKILVRRGQSAILVWKPVTKGVANHLWDCEVYQIGLADMLRLDLVERGFTTEEQVNPPTVPARRRGPPRRGGLGRGVAADDRWRPAY